MNDMLIYACATNLVAQTKFIFALWTSPLGHGKLYVLHIMGSNQQCKEVRDHANECLMTGSQMMGQSYLACRTTPYGGITAKFINLRVATMILALRKAVRNPWTLPPPNLEH